MNRYTQLHTHFGQATLFERAFMFLRLMSCPFEELLGYIPIKGKVLDVGCGFGLLPLLLLQDDPDRAIVGIDPDQRRIEVAQDMAKKFVNAEFKKKTVEKLITHRPHEFAVVTIIDVLYLLPQREKVSLIKNIYLLLAKKGTLLVKINDNSPGWRYLLTWLQEKIVVQLLKKTTAHDDRLYFENVTSMKKLLTKNYFQVTSITKLKTPFPFFHHHWLIIADKKDHPIN